MAVVSSDAVRTAAEIIAGVTASLPGLPDAADNPDVEARVAALTERIDALDRAVSEIVKKQVEDIPLQDETASAAASSLGTPVAPAAVDTTAYPVPAAT